MPTQPVRLRERAVTDIDESVAHYLAEAGADVALRFVDDVERAVRRIERAPRSGGLRFSYELEIPGLRALPLGHFPFLVFYVVGDEFVDVWRVLHTRRDVAAAIDDGATT